MYHTTKFGETVTIAQMGDWHLINTIKILINEMSTARKTLEENQDPGSVVTKALYSSSDLFLENKSAQETLNSHYQSLPHYLFELEIRGIPYPNAREEIQTAVGRSKELPGGLPGSMDWKTGPIFVTT